MRIVFLTNFYPPVGRGGYEQWCQEVAERLRDRGHDLVVLTSRHGRNQAVATDPPWVQRDLHLEMELASLRNGVQFFTSRRRRADENRAILRRLVETLRPDVLLAWGLWNLPRSLPALAEQLMPDRVAYYMGDYWPDLPSQYLFYWDAPARHWTTVAPKGIMAHVARQMLAREERPALRLDHVMFPSAFMRDEFARRGIAVGETTVIYGAADTSPYLGNCGSLKTQNESVSLLYVGRLTDEKGVHTAIEALAILVHERHLAQPRLTIVGAGEPDYETRLHDIARKTDVEAKVTFLGAQPKEAMPEFYRQADVLLFPSIWPEPFGRVLIEAMAAGLVVVGTAAGGAAEILVDGQNALVFPGENPEALAACVACLVESPVLRQRLAETGRQTAIERFDINRMAEEVEAYLQTLVASQ